MAAHYCCMMKKRSGLSSKMLKNFDWHPNLTRVNPLERSNPTPRALKMKGYVKIYFKSLQPWSKKMLSHGLLRWFVKQLRYFSLFLIKGMKNVKDTSFKIDFIILQSFIISYYLLFIISKINNKSIINCNIVL